MKISRAWLQRYFDQELPNAAALADALTFHAFEIESVENDILDVKVTANRGHDCLCHRGIAKELSAILNISIVRDPLKGFTKPLSERGFVNPFGTAANAVSVLIEEPALCPRYIAGHITGVKVGPSPDWLRKFLESIGQKSINNVVDAANFVMFDIGQPLHAFDAGKLAVSGQVRGSSTYSILVRKARAGEKMTTLDDKSYTFTDSTLLIVDGRTDTPIGIAGIKGGKPAGINETTADVIIESANFDGISVRKSAQALKLRTEASTRFEQVISPELAAYGMRAAAELIVEIAGGEIAGFADEYPIAGQKREVSASTAHINAILGSAFSDTDIASALTRLDLAHEQNGGTFRVHPPFERLDLTISEDVAEEVGRIIGYDKISSVELPPLSGKPEINTNFYAAERVREERISQGFSEVFTSVFADKGERVVANKVDGVRPYLRTTLIDGLKAALEKNRRNKDLLGLSDVKLFEIGTVWRKREELTMVGTADSGGVREQPLENQQGDALLVLDSYLDLPLSQTGRCQPFSKYPFIVRDVSLWVPGSTKESEVLDVIRTHAGELLVRAELFDTFKKDGRISLAFRLVFQSFDRTLTDFDVSERMEGIANALKEKEWEVR